MARPGERGCSFNGDLRTPIGGAQVRAFLSLDTVSSDAVEALDECFPEARPSSRCGDRVTNGLCVSGFYREERFARRTGIFSSS
jgi:hypothetical protein